MDEYLQFASRDEFREWLGKHCLTSKGVWLVFGKSGGPKTLKASEALEEALCFGWIDGVMKSIDDTTYIKYFSLRRSKSKWSQKNKNLVMKLEQQGLVTKYGKTKIEEAKKNGEWDKQQTLVITEKEIAIVTEVLKVYELAHTNFIAMSPSVKKTYTKAYFDAKTDAGRESRLAWMVDRLTKNLKPM